MAFNPLVSQVLAAVIAQPMSSTGDVTITIPYSKYLLDRFIVVQNGANSLALLVATLRTAASGAGTLVGTLATGPSASGAFAEIASPLATVRTQTTLYLNITVAGAASSLADIYILGTPIP